VPGGIRRNWGIDLWALEEEYWAKGIDILHKFKQIDKKIPADDVFTLEFLESVYFGKKR